MALPFWRQKGHVLMEMWAAGSHKAFESLGARIAALGVAAGLAAGPGSGCGRPGRHHGLEAALMLCLHGPRRSYGPYSLLPCLLLRGLRDSYPRGGGRSQSFCDLIECCGYISSTSGAGSFSFRHHIRS